MGVRICTPTPSCPVEPPCTWVSPIVCRRKSPLWLLPPSRSRSSLPPSANTPLDRWIHLGLSVHLPTDVDLRAGVRRIRPWNRPPQMLLNYLLNYLEDIGSTPLSPSSSFFLSLILLLLSYSFNSFISHLIYLLSLSLFTSQKGLMIFTV